MIKEMLTAPWHRLATVTRYSTVPKIHKESVAEHSFFVSLYCLYIGEHLNLSAQVMHPLLGFAIAHDIDEALTGDFPRHFKYSHPDLREAIEQGTLRAMETAPEFLQDYWAHDAHPDLMVHILKLADLAACTSWASRELHLGNRSGAEVLERLPHWLDQIEWSFPLRTLVDELNRYALEVLEEYA